MGGSSLTWTVSYIVALYLGVLLVCVENRANADTSSQLTWKSDENWVFYLILIIIWNRKNIYFPTTVSICEYSNIRPILYMYIRHTAEQKNPFISNPWSDS